MPDHIDRNLSTLYYYPFDPMCRLGFTAYTYDPLYRLSAATYPGITGCPAFGENFTYDAVGNRITHTRGSAVHAYEYYPGSNRLKAVHTTNLAGAIEKAYTYNDEGQLTAQTGTGAKTLTWDQKGRPTSITPGGIAANTYAYDPMDRRIARSDSRGNQSELLEGDHLEAIYSGVTLLAKYMRGTVIDEVVNGYQFDTTATWTNYTYHHDLLQSVMGLSGHQGAVLASQSYTAFGENRGSSGSSNSVLKYTGRELDNDSGLYQYRARYYDPATGRFISEDPKGFGAGVNFYSYVNNNPVNHNDPSGMDVNIIINRDTYTDKSITGTFQATSDVTGNSYSGVTLETMTAGKLGNKPPIPSGVYDAFLQKKYDPNRVQLENVPGYSGIQMHIANKPSQLEGCFGVGTALAKDRSDYITGSASALNGLLNVINADGTGNINVQVIGGNHAPRDFDASSGITPSMGSNFGTSGGAAGGFLLYPNKPNTNQIQRAYSK